jgi:hypothetical protein
MREIASPLDGFASPLGSLPAPSFDPASLFASGEQGAWFDPSALTTMFTDTLGLTGAAVGNAVALMFDKSKGLAFGAERVPNPGGPFTSTADWTSGTGSPTLSVSDGNLVITTTTASRAIATLSGLTSGATYKLVDTGRVNIANIRIGTDSGGTTGTTYASGSHFVATAATMYLTLIVSSSVTASISSVSVKELPGNHAIQATLAARPILRQTGGGVYYLEDDLVDDALNWTAPAGTYTVATVNTSGTVSILTSQSLSGETDMLLDAALVQYIAVNRALSGGETTGLTNYLAGLV